MPEHTETTDGAVRGLLKRVTMPVFKTGLVVFLALGIILVLVQAAGILSGDGALVEDVVGVLGIPMTAAAAVTGLVGFVMSYLHRWSGGED
ncbi:hypothetical protein GCM10027445_01830 [Amycolatopsis endophytica]|uniref:Uncharacterized protein n=1 Tax=Amycolatopsis endophytica TaxID=860233 RepID=A0A853B9S3_9PSEU|nr:hypothetical protein [Amycolatopsis endophytica]NYI91477.1 hypothetical protein [Amycolatopsis endophytica]